MFIGAYAQGYWRSRRQARDTAATGAD